MSSRDDRGMIFRFKSGRTKIDKTDFSVLCPRNQQWSLSPSDGIKTHLEDRF